jgi:hypothetical protein
MTIYNKKMKTTKKRVEDAMKENREACILLGEDFNFNRRKRSKKLGRGEGGWEKKIQRQGGKCRGEETDGMNRRKWMGGIERE